ncbi:unnamed protein product [Pleuronectes platessa]|uniref:Uncharacterized protein n=1 Tax=Pleuronectes platessa TaxID=8262 RepID=A0A9N7TXK6_PLEPL|nr:unnamed protein product [Pleuronectes platessa]
MPPLYLSRPRLLAAPVPQNYSDRPGRRALDSLLSIRYQKHQTVELWFSGSFRTQFKILLLVYEALHGLAPQDLSDTLSGSGSRQISQALVNGAEEEEEPQGGDALCGAEEGGAQVLVTSAPCRTLIGPR